MGAIALLLVLSRGWKPPTNLFLYALDVLVLGIGGAGGIAAGADAGAGADVGAGAGAGAVADADAGARKTPSFLAMFNLFQNIFHFSYKQVMVVCMY